MQNPFFHLLAHNSRARVRVLATHWNRNALTWYLQWSECRWYAFKCIGGQMRELGRIRYGSDCANEKFRNQSQSTDTHTLTRMFEWVEEAYRRIVLTYMDRKAIKLENAPGSIASKCCISSNILPRRAQTKAKLEYLHKCCCCRQHKYETYMSCSDEPYILRPMIRSSLRPALEMAKRCIATLMNCGIRCRADPSQRHSSTD